MRIDVEKYLFVGPQKAGVKELFFKEAQKAGFVEFIHPQGKRTPPLSPLAQEFTHAIKIIRSYPKIAQIVHHDRALATKIKDTILSTHDQLKKAQERLQKIEQQIVITRPFGHFSLAAVAKIDSETKRKVRFYIGKTSKHLIDVDSDLVLIQSLEGIDYFICIKDEPLSNKDLIEQEISTSLDTLLDTKAALTLKIEALENELKRLNGYNWLMHYGLVEELNHIGFQFAAHSTDHHLDEALFTIEGWVPKNKKKELLAIAEKMDIFAEQVAIEEHQQAPTFLDNKGTARVGEDLVHIFDTPSNTDKDPSLWVLSCFALFFAMIVGDAGYGLVFFAAALFIRLKVKGLKGFAKRATTLLTILSVFCIVWGLLINSIFGIKCSEENPLRKYSMIEWLIAKKAEYHLQQKDDVYEAWVKQLPSLADVKTGHEFITHSNNAGLKEIPADRFIMNIFMELALLVGSIHVILGLLRYLRKNPTGAGWIAFIIGCYLYFPLYLNATSLLHFVFHIDKAASAAFGLQALCGGLGFAVIAAIIRGGIFGIFEIMTAVQVFADILSYLRIFALGLAGAIMSATINDLTSGLPLFIAIFVTIFAHFINILLAIMGGVIHGLRLNFLEWYHYSFEGGGKLFKPLELHQFD